jgi:hypothetical protein
LVGVDLDGGRVLGEDRRPERGRSFCGLPGQGRLPSPGGHGPYLGQLPVALLLQGVGGFPFRRDLGLVLAQLVRGQVVSAFLGGPGQDGIGLLAGLAAPSLELIGQVRHGPHPTHFSI